MAFVPTDLIEVRNVRGKGRGVFARDLIPDGCEFEVCPVLLLPESQMMETPLSDYVFEWAPGRVALVLGFGSLYNHSYEPNAATITPVLALSPMWRCGIFSRVKRSPSITTPIPTTALRSALKSSTDPLRISSN